MTESNIDIVARFLSEQPTALDSRFVVRDRDTGAKWPSGLSATGAGGAVSHYMTRQNARTAMQESPQARAMIERMADTVAHTGLRLELAPKIEVLGITQAEAAKWARDVESRFDLWAKDKKQHRKELVNFYQAQNMYQLFQHRDNDIFVRLFYDKDSSLQNPLQFDFLDPDMIRGDAYTTTYGFQSLADGIKRDERGREVEYRIWIRKNDNGQIDQIDLPAKSPDGKRPFVLHGFRGEYAGQGRGFSRLAHAIQDFENITDFSAATIKKAINQSQIVGFVEPSKEEDAINPFEGVLTSQGAGPAAKLFGSNPEEVNGIPITPPPARLGVTECFQVPEATMDTPGSMFIANLTKGSSIKFAANTSPAESFDKFVDAFAGHLSASLNIPLEVVLMKFGQNYSASRATLLLFWLTCEIWRAEMAADFLDPVVESWLAEEIAANRVTAPGWSDPRMRAAWLNKNWIGTPPPDIDPTKTATARRQNIETGVTNLDAEARMFNGSSAAANLEKNRALFAVMPPSPWQVQGGDGGNSDKGGNDD